jgi:hypothetical protein
MTNEIQKEIVLPCIYSLSLNFPFFSEFVAVAALSFEWNCVLLLLAETKKLLVVMFL